ncbi:MAG: class I SAM-dependent methyltransferase, partial [Firmicutes bacterium]|nr:class I SAM-dependent methyltransferase [Bacillota bacterium]
PGYPKPFLTLVESVGKKISFLEDTVERLGLEGVEILPGRAEEWGRKEGKRESFDMVVARAVAELRVLAEYCLPLTRTDGAFVAYKGGEGMEEVVRAARALRVLGGTVEKTKHLSLPQGMGERTLILLRKIRPTPDGYPRRAGIPEKRPLSND